MYSEDEIAEWREAIKRLHAEIEKDRAVSERYLAEHKNVMEMLEPQSAAGEAAYNAAMRYSVWNKVLPCHILFSLPSFILNCTRCHIAKWYRVDPVWISSAFYIYEIVCWYLIAYSNKYPIKVSSSPHGSYQNCSFTRHRKMNVLLIGIPSRYWNLKLFCLILATQIYSLASWGSYLSIQYDYILSST